MADFTAALIRRDIESALTFVTDEVVFFYSNGSVITGKAAFSALMTASWKMVEDYRYATLGRSWIVETDAVAAVIYGFEWSGTVRGEKVGASGRGTRVFCRNDSGWLIAHEHLSSGQWSQP
jgi:ketosteroid isomerase-like protein